ncbi:MAG: tetratricopeptide repeat protein [Candidatus Eremiobacteraeota bacterium]|nr:tetratricopeptide repeat protein [Candidatus Eremiobacteraeota bacterium]MBV8223447.1 tetratricopeptide repeat protein [Candidatus Eremiobacteraeota bacterium]MBV8282863.1 tetratricopeptide repeat protein [Candidatus Eremiobacteraeota bacterium]
MSMRMESSGSRKGPTTPFELGLKALADRQYDLAVKLFSDAADAGVRRAEALSKRGVCRLHMEDRRSAEADFEAALQADPRHAPALTNLGNLALEDGRLAEARARYEAAISADPDYALAHHNFAVLLKREGKVGDSVRELRLAAKLEAGSFWDFLSGRRRRT